MRGSRGRPGTTSAAPRRNTSISTGSGISTRTAPRQGRIRIAPEVVERFLALRDDGKPALFFAAHLANWELPAIAAAKHGLPAAVLYRTPNNPHVARDIVALRTESMGRLIPASIEAPIRMMEALDQGLHVGMLIDQRFGRGPQVPFLGRLAYSNPLVAHLARRFDCPVHGARAIREADGGFRLELTEAVELPRDAKRPHRCGGGDRADEPHRRGLGARASGAVVVDASPLAIGQEGRGGKSIPSPNPTLPFCGLAPAARRVPTPRNR